MDWLDCILLWGFDDNDNNMGSTIVRGGGGAWKCSTALKTAIEQDKKMIDNIISQETADNSEW